MEKKVITGKDTDKNCNMKTNREWQRSLAAPIKISLVTEGQVSARTEVS